MASHRSDRYAERPHKHREHQQPHPTPFSGWAGWKSSGENIYIYICTTWVPPAAVFA